MCRRNRQQRSIIASALFIGLQEYQARNKARARARARALPPSSTTDMTTARSFQEPMTQGVTYMAPRYVEPIDPNPPAYEEVATNFQNNNNNIPSSIIDEKRLLHRLNTEEQVPPHVSRDYNPNTGLDASVPPPPPLITLSPATTSSSSSSTTHQTPTSLSHLLDAISLYFDTQIKLHSDSPSTVRKLESKKAKRLSKAEKKFYEKMAKGKDSMKNDSKMEKRAEKMEKYTEWVLQRSMQQHQHQQYKYNEGHGRRHGGRCCSSAAAHASEEQYRSVVV